MNMKKELQLNESLAALGHGKWKRALGCTLLMIGLLMGGMNAWGQTPIPDALKLDKKFIKDDETGHSGKLWIETYTTGDVEQVTATQPTDIVLVLDVSNSMSTNYMSYGSSNITRLAALKLAVQSFVNEIFEDARDNDCEHRMAVVSFCSQSDTKLLTTSSTVSYNNFSTTNYQNALVVVNDDGSLNTRLGDQLISRITTGQGTQMDAGLYAAAGILNARSASGGGGATFVVPGTTTELPRNMVVVFFTDGYPTTRHGNSSTETSTLQYIWPSNWDLHTIADAACVQAAAIKSIEINNPSGGAAVSPTIYSIGVNPACAPTDPFKTTANQTYGGYTGWTTGVAAFNGLLHFISSNFDKTYNSWQNNTTNDYGTFPERGNKYLAATNVNDLIEAFSTISSSSGGTTVDLGASTVVQDVISASFKLPDNANADSIKVYAPKLNRMHRADANSPWLYDFTAQTITIGEEEIDVDTITGGTGYSGRLTLNLETGRVTDSTYENRVNSSDVISISEQNKTISFTHFDFSHYYCGPIIDNGDTIGYRGRKLVMVIPIEIEEGVWGDGIATNGELSFVTPNDTTHYQFPQPIADVLGDVWTEIVQYQPTSFTVPEDGPIEIGTPEELAWFISYVNGRAGYGVNNTVASHPDADAILTADIDMSAHNWVPIGTGKENANGTFGDDKLAYVGTFDGNGHVITGLKNNASKYYKRAEGQTEGGIVVFPGMFSNVGDGGVVKNVFVLDADFRGRHHDRYFVHHGIIADTLSAGGQIFNCEAVGSITCNNEPDHRTEDMKLVYGGLVGLNHGTIHSSMAMATLTAYSMGGLVGENRGSIGNSFTNGVYNYLGTSDGVVWDIGEDPDGLFRYVGGLVGRNHGGEFVGEYFEEVYGSVNNCYVRFQRPNDFGATTGSNAIKFGQFVGTNVAPNGSGNVTSCYYPWTSQRVLVADDATTSASLQSNYVSAPTDPTLMRWDRSNDNMVGGTYSEETYHVNGLEVKPYVWHNGTTLVDVLNGNIPENNSTWARWTRTTAGSYSATAGDINDDYPVLKISDFTCLASTDGIALDYAPSFTEMLNRHNTGTMNVNTLLPNTGSGHTGGGSHDYHVSQTVNKTQSDLIYGATINLYANDTTSLSTTANTVVYIDENVSLLQNKTNSSIDAYTGQHIIDFGSTDDPQSGNRWHLVSSSLTNSMFGWGYGTESQVEHNWESNPCNLWLSGSPEVQLFPIDMQSPNPMDFYCFYEPKYHWINFKRNSNSHWHMESPETQIIYDNEDHFYPGKGYLLALHTEYFQWEDENMHLWTESDFNKKDRTLLQNRGTLNNGNVDIPVTYTTDAIIDLDGYKTHLEGYNLLGNPYQSYLDFDLFVEGNSGDEENSIPSLWEGSKYSKTYAVFDPSDVTTTGPKGGSYIQYMANSSKGSASASRYINMHQGFFIQVGQNGTAHFTNDMRTLDTDAQTGFRGEQPAYPLINFTVTDYEGETDLAVLELNRPENDGAKKLRMGSPAGRIYFRYDNTNLAIYFRNSDKDYQTLNFSAEEDGNFTLSWNMANADFSSLTLVDNITGIKTDMLTHDHYTFEGRMEDYNTRFKIVFGEMNNNEEEPVLEHFAFFDHGNLIVNGTGHFEVVDVMGRVLYAVELTDTQNTVSLPSNVRGVCMLCFTRNNETKVQKMVIQ